MLEALNNGGCIAQPFGLRQEYEKYPPQCCQYKHKKTMWWPCLITISSTSKNVVDRKLVNWKQPELTNNKLKRQMSLLCKTTNEWTGDVPSNNLVTVSMVSDFEYFKYCDFKLPGTPTIHYKISPTLYPCATFVFMEQTFFMAQKLWLAFWELPYRLWRHWVTGIWPNLTFPNVT